MHFPSIYFGFLFESPLDRPIRSSIDVDRPIKVAVRPTPVGTSPGVVRALPVIPFGALNRNPSNPAAWKGNWKKKHFSETKNLDSIRETAETQKLQIWRGKRTFSQFIISTWQVPARNLSNFAYWWAVRSKLGKRGPSDQNMPRVNMPRVNIFPPNKRYEPIGDWLRPINGHMACQATNMTCTTFQT